MNRLDLDCWICDAQAAIFMGGGGSSTTVEQPQPTPEQTALTQAQVDLANEQLAQLKSQGGFNKELQDAFGPLIPQYADMLKQQIEQSNSPAQKQITDAQNQLTLLQLQSAQKDQPIQDQILQQELDNLKNGGAATPEQQAQIDTATKESISAGTANINQWVSDATKQIAQELAPQLGLRPTDQPIIDRAGQIAKAGLTQVGALTSNLEAANAEAKLNLPLAVQQIQSGVASGAAGLQNTQQSFAQQLAQQAALNRLQLFGAGGGAINSAGSLGLGLAGIGPSFNLGPVATTQNQNTRTDNTGQLISSGLGAAAGLAAMAFMSSRLVKSRRAAADGEAILQRLRDLAIDRWAYHGDSAEHVGPYAEDFNKAFDLGDGRSISVIDALGILFAAVKALSQRPAVPA